MSLKLKLYFIIWVEVLTQTDKFELGISYKINLKAIFLSPFNIQVIMTQLYLFDRLIQQILTIILNENIQIVDINILKTIIKYIRHYSKNSIHYTLIN